MAVVCRSKRASDLAGRQLVNLIDDANPGPGFQSRANSARRGRSTHRAGHRQLALATPNTSCAFAGSGPELQDPVVAVSRASPTVAVAGCEPQRAIRCGDNGAQPSVLSDKQRFRIGQ